MPQPTLKEFLNLLARLYLAQVFDISADKDAEEKYKLASKLHKAQLLADAISVQDNLDQIATNLNDIVVYILNKT